jgi:predicted P-loop ATPase
MADTEPTPKRQKPLPPLARAAAQYAAKGYRVFPLEPRGKTPRTEHGVKDATTDADQVSKWWRAIPDANIGIATGNGLLVLDIDGETGAASLASLIDLYGPLPLTPTQKTGKGRHYLFRVETPIKNSASRIAAGIDTRGDGGYIVGGPSIHPSGEPYAWDEDARPSRIDLAPCPQWILDKLAPKISERAAVQQPAPADADPATLSKYAASALDAEFDRVSSAGKGTRNATLNTAAFSLGQLVGAGLLSEALVLSTLQTAAQNCGYLAEEGPQHVDRIIASGLAAGVAKPRLVELKARNSVGSRKQGNQAAAVAATGNSSGSGAQSESATVHSLDEARRQAPAWRESVWLGETPEDLVMNADGGIRRTSIRNGEIYMEKTRALAGLFALDELSQVVFLTRGAPWDTEKRSRVARDTDATALACWFDENGLNLGRDKCRDLIRLIAERTVVNPVRDRLLGLQWDGVNRLEHWLIDHGGAEDTSFVQQVSAKWLISAAARILNPGCKVDTMLVLEGPQGAGKSTSFQILADVLGEDLFTDRLSNIESKDSAIELQGRVIVEMAELAVIRGARVESIKAFLTRQTDKVRLPFDRAISTLARSCVFAGSVNPGGNGWLHDVTGNRRFWPVAVEAIDNEALKEIAPQLWAEAVSRYRGGEEWWLTDQVVIAQADAATKSRIEEDPWATEIERFLAAKYEVTVDDILKELVTDRSKWTQREKIRVISHLKLLDWWKPNPVYSKDRRGSIRVWRHPDYLDIIS